MYLYVTTFTLQEDGVTLFPLSCELARPRICHSPLSPAHWPPGAAQPHSLRICPGQMHQVHLCMYVLVPKEATSNPQHVFRTEIQQSLTIVRQVSCAFRAITSSQSSLMQPTCALKSPLGHTATTVNDFRKLVPIGQFFCSISFRSRQPFPTQPRKKLEGTSG